MDKVFIVVRGLEYGGDCIERVFAKRADAVKYADELAEANKNKLFDVYCEFDVREREIY
jgi:hypothetical protein